MASSNLFSRFDDLSADERQRLSAAYEQACSELITEYGYSDEQLATLSEPMTVAVLAMYRAGQRDEQQIARYAAFKAICEKRQH